MIDAILSTHDYWALGFIALCFSPLLLPLLKAALLTPLAAVLWLIPEGSRLDRGVEWICNTFIRPHNV